MQLKESQEKKKLKIGGLDFDITTVCNVKCAGCNHFNSLAKEAWYINLDTIQSLFNRVNDLFEVERIGLSGGDPLFHPQLEDIVDCALQIFGDKTKICIFHNGTMLDKFNKLVNRYKDYPQVMFQYDVYPISEDVHNGDSKVKYRKRFEMSYLNLRLDESADASKSAETCMCKGDFGAIDPDGNIYPCALSRNLYLLNNHFNLNIDVNKYCVNIYKNEASYIAEQLNNIRTNHTCKMCVGRANRTLHAWHKSNKELKEWVSVLPDGTEVK